MHNMDTGYLFSHQNEILGRLVRADDSSRCRRRSFHSQVGGRTLHARGLEEKNREL